MILFMGMDVRVFTALPKATALETRGAGSGGHRRHNLFLSPTGRKKPPPPPAPLNDHPSMKLVKIMEKFVGDIFSFI